MTVEIIPSQQKAKDGSGFTHFGSQIKPWPNCGFKSKNVEVRVRRVTQVDRDEAQLEITITEDTGKQIRRKDGGLVLSPEGAISFALALLEGTEYINLIKRHQDDLLTL